MGRDLSACSHQAETVGNGMFHSGVYYGTKDAARVEITDRNGATTSAALVELPGEPGWGAWYVTTSRSAAGDDSITL